MVARAPKYQKPIFHDDGFAKYRLGLGSTLYVMVRRNWRNEYSFGTVSIHPYLKARGKYENKRMYQIRIIPK